MIKEYLLESGTKVNLTKLKSKLMPTPEYSNAHKYLVIPCHDVLIEFNKGILLVKRDNLPEKGNFWAVGGRVKRGIKIEDSLREKTKQECNLDLEEIKYLGCARMFFTTDPFQHGKGTDSLGLMYFGKGKGKLKLDKNHIEHKLVTPKNYTKEFRATLHPYVRHFLDIVIKDLE